MTYCYNCFHEKTGDGPCPLCGYDPQFDAGKYPSALPHGSILAGQYITGRVLGQGGFGITYLAFDTTLRVKVAIKEFLPESMAGRSAAASANITVYSGERGEQFRYGLEHFLDEARVLAKFLGNPNIVGVRSYFEENNTAYFVMEYVEGISLKTYLKNHGGSIGWEDAVKLLMPVMDALCAVHKEGLIHRDVAPDNIYITGSGTVKLLDFGAARYSLGTKSQSLDVVLKHGYAPKEQYMRRGRQGAYTDVYALAATFYAAVTGYLPPDALDRMEEDDLVAPSTRGVHMPPELEQAILHGLEVRAEDRFQTMKEFQDAVYKAVTPPKREPEPAEPAGNGEKEEPSPAPNVPPAPEEPKDSSPAEDPSPAPPAPNPVIKFAAALWEKLPGRRKWVFPAAGACAAVLVIAAAAWALRPAGASSVPAVDTNPDGTAFSENFTEVTSPQEDTSGVSLPEQEDEESAALETESSAVPEEGDELSEPSVSSADPTVQPDPAESSAEPTEPTSSVPEQTVSRTEPSSEAPSVSSAPVPSAPSSSAPPAAPASSAPSQPPAPAAKTVSFSDSILGQCISKALRKDAGSVTEDDLLQIQKLKIYRWNDVLRVTVNTGVEREIDCPKSQAITNLSDLALLKNCTSLTIEDQNLSNLQPIASMTGLTELVLKNNQISDISPLAGLKSLRKLDMEENSISNLSALPSLTNLTQLNLRSNQITDISALTGLKNLTEIDLWYNSISDISPLSGLTNLTMLAIGGNQISDLRPLSGLTGLTELTLSSNQISDISPLAGLVNLKSLTLYGNQVSDVSALAGMTKLEELRLMKNPVSSLEPLSGLVNLKLLQVDSSVDQSPVAHLPNLQ